MYQTEHDRVLLSKREFLLEETGEVISGVSFMVRFSNFYSIKPSLGGQYLKKSNGDYLTLNDLIRVAYDSETKEFSFFPEDVLGNDYEIVGYAKDVSVNADEVQGDERDQGIARYTKELGISYSIEHNITKEEFSMIIQKYGHLFETDNSLQSTSYSFHKMSDEDMLRNKGKMDNFFTQQEEHFKKECDEIILREEVFLDKEYLDEGHIFNKLPDTSIGVVVDKRYDKHGIELKVDFNGVVDWVDIQGLHQ